MARLPTRDDLGGMPSARSGRVIASYDTSAAGRGLADLGASIAGAATDIARIGAVSASSRGAGGVSQAEQFEAQRKFLEFSSAQEQAYEESKNTVDPGAFGFREKAQNNYKNAAKDFFKSIPDALKPEYDMKLFQVEDNVLSKSRAFETTARTKYYDDEVNKGLGTLENKLFSNPGDFDKNFSEGANFINAIPDESLSRIQKADLVKQWRSKAQLASLNGVTPQERIRLLGGVPDEILGAKPSPHSPIEATGGGADVAALESYIRDAAAKRGIDPDIAVRVARSEGLAKGVWQSNVINKAGKRETSYGPFQLLVGGGLGDKFQRMYGKSPADPSTVYNQIDFALDEAASGGWSPWYGAAKVGVGSRTGLDKASALGIMDVQFDAARADPRFADMNYADAQKIIQGSQSEINEAMKQADALRREAAVIQRGTIEAAIQNAPVAILNTGAYDGQLPSRDQFIEAYGAQDGSDRFAKFSSAVDVSKQAHDFRAMPADEIQAAVDQAKPTASGNTAAFDTARHETLSAAAQETIKARNADPSAYVQQTFPNVAKAWEEAEGSGDYRTALAATSAAQQQLGIREMRLLPKQVAAQTITSFKDETVPGEQRIAAVTGMLFSTSDPTQRRAIFDQLVEAGLPDVTEGAVEAYARGDEGAGRRLMEAAIIDPLKLPGTTNLKPSDIDAEIQSQLMDEGQIGDLVYGLSDGTIENQESAIRDSKLLTNAVNIRVRNGETLDAAVQSAAKDLYGDIQAVTGNGDVNAQIVLPTGTDPVPVLDGLTGLLPTVRGRLEASVGGASKIPAGPEGPVKGIVENGNIDLEKRPRVKNEDGTVSTVRSMSFNEDGQEILIPTVSPSGAILTDEGAIALYHATGNHLGKFGSAEDATAYAEQLHKTQEAFYASRSTGGSKVIEATTSNYIDNVMAEGYFRNSGAGYVFIDPFVGAAVAGPDGKPLIFTDADILAAPRPAPRVEPAIANDGAAVVQQPQTQQEIDRETYGEFAPMLDSLSGGN